MTGSVAARLLFLLLPIACVGLFARVLYTPDEPREASLVVAMASQADKSLPELAGRPFAEKPPLLYWLGGAAVAALGPSPAATRLPNLVYLLLAALAIASLVTRAAGPTAGFAAGAVVATSLQLYQVLIWLATDAPLVAGVAVALLGSYLGLTAAARPGRYRGYAMLYAGLAIAFFAKGFAGWMVPVFAFLTVVVAERRWRELLRVELWAGLPVLALLLLGWVAWVAAAPGGAESLRVLFWYNLVGRAVSVASPAQFAYTTGHANSPGKYLLELPMYLLPWTPLAFVALRRAPRAFQTRGPEGTAWRLALGAIVPATLLLSFAATARGVYYGPPALGFAMLVGLYVGRAGAVLDRIDRLAWRLTGALIALVAALLGALAVLANWAPLGRTDLALGLGLVALVAAAFAVYLGLRSRDATAVPPQAFAVTLVLTLVVGPLYLRLNGWLDLETLATRIEAAAGPAPLVVLYPDETTLALVDLYLPKGRVAAIVRVGDADGAARASAALQGPARLLWLVPDHAHWGLGAWLSYLAYRDGVPAAATSGALPEGLGALRTECLLQRAGGRAIALLARDGAAPLKGTVCR